MKRRTLTIGLGSFWAAILVGLPTAARAGVNASGRLVVDLDPATAGLQSARSVGINTEFDVDLVAQGVSDLHGVHFNLTFEATKLQLVKVGGKNVREGPFLGANATGDPTVFLGTLDGSTINVSTAILGQNFGVDGDGVVAQVRFKALTAGSTTLAWSHVLCSDHNNVQDDVSGNCVDGKVVAYGAVAGFDVEASPQVPVGGVARVTVTARDAAGNVNPTYTGTIRIASSDPRAVLPGDLTFAVGDQGARTTQVTLRTAGTQTVTATDTAQPGIQGTSAGIQVVTRNAGSTWYIDLDPAAAGLQPTRTVEVGEEFDLELRAASVEDLHGVNLDLSFDEALLQLVLVAGKLATEGPFLGSNQAGEATTFLATLTPGEPAVLNLAATILGEQAGVAGGGGVASVRFKARQAGDAALALLKVVASDRYGNTDDVSGNARSAAVTIGEVPQPIVATHFLVSTQVESVVGQPLSLTVTAVDDRGQTAVGYKGTVALTSTDPAAVLPAALEFRAEDAGLRMAEITFNTAGLQKVTATDGVRKLTGTSSGTQVSSRNRDAGLVIDLNPATEPVDTALTVAQGLEFNAVIVANHIADLHDLNVDLTFDPNLLELVPQNGKPAQEGEWLPTAGATTFFATVKGSVLNVTTTLLGTDPGVSGSGVVVRLRWRAKARGTAAVALTRAVMADRYGNQDDVSAQAGAVSVRVTAVSKLQVITPETAAQGQPVYIGLKVTDEAGVIIPNYEGTVALSTTDEAAMLPATVRFTAAEGGQKSVVATFRTLGLQTVTATDAARGLTATSASFLVVGLSPRAVVAVDLDPKTEAVDSFRDAAPDEEFEAVLVASNVVDLHGVHLTLTYDASKLEIVPVGGRDVQEGPFLLLNPSAQPTYFIAAQRRYGDIGVLDLATTILGSRSGVNGRGVLGKVRFRVRNMGASDLTFTAVTIAHQDNSTEDITANSINGVVSVRDTVPPSVTELTPPEGSFVWNNFKPTLSARLADQLSGSGLNPASIRMTLDGVVVEPSYNAGTGIVSYLPKTELEQDVPHRVRLVVADRDGNEATVAWSFTVSQRTPPRASIALTPPSPLRAGTVQVRLVASEKLADRPKLTFKPQGRLPIPITNLQTTDFVLFQGSFEVTPETGDGLASFSFEGTDVQDGLLGTEITAGELFLIDTTPPAAGVNWDPPSPLTLGTATVTVTITEDLAAQPTLALVLEGQTPLNIPLTGSGSQWQGTLTVTDTMPNGAYTVQFSGRDAVGNVGATVLQGQTLVVDTIPPEKPTVLRARVRSAGKVQLTWLPPANEPVRLYRLYRSTTLPVLPQAAHRIAESLAVGSTYLDTVPADGTYFYAVSAVDFAGNEGPLSDSARATTDQDPPGSPRNLTATVTAQQQVSLAWQPPLGEAAAYYTLYRSDADITAENFRAATKVRSGIVATTYVDTPSSAGDLYYALTAADAVGNEGLPSASMRVAFDNVPPTATISLSGEAVRQGQETLVGVGTVQVSLVVSEDLRARPTLRLKKSDGAVVDLAVTRTGRSLAASFSIAATDPSGYYTFSFSGTDGTGNEGTVVTSGARFYVATKPPDPIQVLTATPQANGHVALAWVPPTIGDAFLRTFGNLQYRVYRDTLPQIVKDPAKRLPDPSSLIAGSSFTDAPPAEGLWYYAVAPVDPAGNEGALSPSVGVSSDRTPPNAPTNLQANLSRTVDLLWSPPPGEAAAGYHIYRSTVLITAPDPPLRLTSQPVRDTAYSDFPPATSLYFYAVTALDAAGNESPVSNSPGLNFEQLEPVATITLAGPGVKRAGPIPLVGFGELTLTLATSRPLREPPSVTYQPSGGTAIPLTVSGSGAAFTASFQIVPGVGDGVATFGFAGVGANGMTGNAILRGSQFLIDTTPPTGSVTLDHPSILRPGTDAHLQLLLSEAVPGTPVLKWTDAQGRETPLPLVGSGQDFRGSLHIPGDAPVGQAFFSLEATDYAGNKGTEITAGSLLTIVKSAPNRPEEPKAKRQPQGAIRLTWERPVYEPPEVPQPLAGYYVYRHTTATVSPRRDYRVTVEAVTGNEWTDIPPADGTYFYVITALNKAGLESLSSEIVFADSDRTPPLPPTLNPLQKVSQDTQVKLTWQPRGAEVPVAFNVYRSDREILTTAGLTPLNGQPLPHSQSHPGTTYTDTPPADGTYFYAVTALDDLGQESPPSPNQRIDFAQPSARATIVLIRNGQPGVAFTQGEVDLLLTTDKPLLQTPTLTFTPYGSQEPRPVDLVGGGTQWQGKLTIDQTIPDGEARFAFTGVTEVQGAPVAGSVIVSGDRFWVDTSGPTRPSNGSRACRARWSRS